jgi:hypothetical protein
MNGFIQDLRVRWCRWMHRTPMWPINGRYRCPTCMREYEVPWANHDASAERRDLLVDDKGLRPKDWLSWATSRVSYGPESGR